jgi:hypothetical protein
MRGRCTFSTYSRGVEGHHSALYVRSIRKDRRTNSREMRASDRPLAATKVPRWFTYSLHAFQRMNPQSPRSCRPDSLLFKIAAYD